ncbi:GTP-binding protein, partial [Candidatus Magnetomorum sp. HK-1]
MTSCSECSQCLQSKNNIKPGIAILGNMNVGKSTLFSRICSSKSEGVNFPGNTVTIETSLIKGTNKYAFDTPGIFSIFSNSEDVRASRSILLSDEDYKIEGILLVADAKTMKRSISLALQFAEYGLPMFLDINMIDEASPRGIKIDKEKLSSILNINFCSTVAREGIGISKVVDGISKMQLPEKLITYPDWVENFLSIVSKLLKNSYISPRAIGLLLLAEDLDIE